MKNVCLHIAIQTPRSLATHKRVNAFCEALGELNPDFTPQKFGVTEPIKLKFDLNAVKFQLTEFCGASGGSMMFSFKSPIAGNMHYMANRGPRVRSNGLMIRFKYDQIAGRLAEVENLIKLMFSALDAAYACATLSGGHPHYMYVSDLKKNWGEINGIEIPPWNPSGIDSLPGICWINVFGKEYVQFIGKHVLNSVSARTLNENDIYWLKPCARPEDMFTPSGLALATKIKNDFGNPQAFFGYDVTQPFFRVKYDKPYFDFSEIRD